MDLLGQYALLPTMVLGLVTTLGLFGVGEGLWRIAGHQPSDLHRPLAYFLSGSVAYVLIIQLLALAQLSTIPVMQGVWWSMILSGLGGMTGRLLEMRAWLGRLRTPSMDGYRLTSLALLLVSIAALGVASSLPTHPDALYYHLLYGKRIVEDGGLVHYRFPIHAAVPTQMLFQAGTAPLWTFGQPGAWQWANITCWFFALCLLWRWARESTWCASSAAMLVSAAGSSLIVVAWYAEAGAHGFGDAAGLGAVSLLLTPGRQRSGRDHALMGLYLLTMTGAKLSAGPIALILGCGYVIQTIRSNTEGGGAWRPLALLSIPILLVHAPMLIYGLIETGSPLGPYLSEALGSDYYAKPGLETNLSGTITNNRYDVSVVVMFFILFIQPTVWVALSASLITASRQNGYATILLALGLQVCLMAVTLPPDPRFLSGLHYAGLLMLPLRFSGVTLAATPRALRLLGVGATLLWSVLPLAHASEGLKALLSADAQHRQIAEQSPDAPALRALAEQTPLETRLVAPRGMSGKKLALAASTRPIVLVPDDVLAEDTPLALIWLGPQRDAPIKRTLRPFRGVARGAPLAEPITITWPDDSGAAEVNLIGLYELSRLPSSSKSATNPLP